MFSGTWELDGSLDTPWLEGRPQLLIGHYGNELVGTVLFNDSVGVNPAERCPCGYIIDTAVYIDDEAFNAVSEDCDGARLVWVFTLGEDDNGDPVLNGRVYPPDKTCAAGECDVTFVLFDRFVNEDLKACAPLDPPELE